MVLDKELDWLYYKPHNLISKKALNLFMKHDVKGMEVTPMYEKESWNNRHGYAITYGGVEIIMDGQSSLEGVNPDDFPLAEKD